LNNQVISVSPNPAQESFQIGLPFWALNAELVVFDVTGKEVLSKVFTGNQTTVTRNAIMPAGLYFAVVNLNGNRFTGKIVLF
jgi:hypothetical protein